MLNYSHAVWKARADALIFRHRAFIGGQICRCRIGLDRR
jgi:hypothetical protein